MYRPPQFLYLIPLDLVTTTKTSQFIGGELAFFPDLFVNVMTILPVLTTMSCFLILLSLVFKRVDKKKWYFFSLVCALFILICSLVLFSIAMSAFTKVGVGSFLGQGIIDVSVQVEGYGNICVLSVGARDWFLVVWFVCSDSIIHISVCSDSIIKKEKDDYLFHLSELFFLFPSYFSDRFFSNGVFDWNDRLYYFFFYFFC